MKTILFGLIYLLEKGCLWKSIYLNFITTRQSSLNYSLIFVGGSKIKETTTNQSMFLS
jgi:hypothetical protein